MADEIKLVLAKHRMTAGVAFTEIIIVADGISYLTHAPGHELLSAAYQIEAFKRRRQSGFVYKD